MGRLIRSQPGAGQERALCKPCRSRSERAGPLGTAGMLDPVTLSRGPPVPCGVFRSTPASTLWTPAAPPSSPVVLTGNVSRHCPCPRGAPSPFWRAAGLAEGNTCPCPMRRGRRWRRWACEATPDTRGGHSSGRTHVPQQRRKLLSSMPTPGFLGTEVIGNSCSPNEEDVPLAITEPFVPKHTSDLPHTVSRH